MKKQDYLESIRPFRREIFKKPELKFWKVNDFSAKPKLILAPSLQKQIREKTIKKSDLKIEDEILMPTDPELQLQFQKYDRLVSDFYKETATRFDNYKDIIS